MTEADPSPRLNPSELAHASRLLGEEPTCSHHWPAACSADDPEREPALIEVDGVLTLACRWLSGTCTRCGARLSACGPFRTWPTATGAEVGSLFPRAPRARALFLPWVVHERSRWSRSA